MATSVLQFVRQINAPPQQVYFAFTNATTLREWLCDVATTDPKPGGRLYLAWNQGYYAAGEYLSLEEGKSVFFSYQGRNEPKPTRVEVRLLKRKGGTRLKLTHRGLGRSKKWSQVMEEFTAGWENSLENLASVLESGEDLRITRRPMIGITVNDFNADIAKSLGVPVSEGLRIDTTLEGMGAQVAGLQGNDVIVEMAGRKIRDYPDIPLALQGQRAGDKVKVEFYRGPEKKVTTLEFSRRVLPEIPPTISQLGELVKERTAQQKEALVKLLEGVSEAEGSYKPAPAEWSAKHVLAHLIQGERAYRINLSELVASQERWADDYNPTLEGELLATLAVYPTLKELLAALLRDLDETAELIAHLPQDFPKKKSTYWRMAYEAVQAPYHMDTHREQIKSAIEAARKNK